MIVDFLQVFIGLAVLGIFGATFFDWGIEGPLIFVAAAGAALVITAVRYGARTLYRRIAERRKKQQLW